VAPISCVQGTGIDDLLIDALAGMPQVAVTAETETPLRLTVVGRPNVGKSSLVNRLLNSNRMIVSEIPGTTRDTVDMPFTLRLRDQRLPAVLVDTAGLRHKHKVASPVELFSVMRAGKAIERADLVLFLLEANTPPTSQDRRIANLIVTESKPCVLVANKWDLLPAKVAPGKFEADLRFELPFMAYAPLVGVSALQDWGMPRLLETIFGIREKMLTVVPTAILNQFLHDLVQRNPPPASGGRRFKLFYTTMISALPPRLLAFVNDRRLGTRAYLQFLETRVREAFYPCGGIPVSITLRDRPQTERPQRRSRPGAPRPAAASGPHAARQGRRGKPSRSKGPRERRRG